MIHLSPDLKTRFEIYQALLLKWQKSVNLVSDSTIADSWNRHFIDSAQLAKYITRQKPVVVDIGSGGGFPGMILAMMIDGEFHLIEKDKKKCVFLSEVSRETKTKVIIHDDRIETSSIHNVGYITSRACANVSQLFDWTEKLVSHETKCLFLKGENYSIEIDEAKKDWQFEIQLHPSLTKSESAILELYHISRRRK
ncbi:MAG: 16S rRNA (guanine(527)-N(7))-methyltransferase RsmG [Alphaproteobacteria bacterium]|nr:16S rRNA (guanine(527)-N(7))-methyltransferase RsmG [Alphaproteobacteria bacterium]